MIIFYGVLAASGIAFPYCVFLPWVATHGKNIDLLLQSITGNNISLIAWLNVVISALTFIGFIFYEDYKSKIKYNWVTISVTLTVVVSFG